MRWLIRLQVRFTSVLPAAPSEDQETARPPTRMARAGLWLIVCGAALVALGVWLR